MSPRAFDRSFSSSDGEGKKGFSKSDWHIIRRIIRAFSPYKGQVILVLIAIAFTTLLGLINPLMIKFVFDDAIGKRNLTLLVIFVAIMIVTPIITGIIGVGQTYINNVVGQNVMKDFRDRLFEHLQKMPIAFFTSTKTGEMQSRLSNDVSGVQTAITDTATTIISNLSIVISTVIAMAILSPILTLVSLGMMPLFLWITYKVGHVRRSTSSDTQKSLAALTATMQETLSISGVMLIKTYGRQKFVEKKFHAENEKVALLQIKQQMIGRWFFMFIGTFFSIIPAVIYLIAGLQIIHNPLHAAISLGGIVAFTTLQSRVFFPIGQLLNVQIELQGALALFERIFEYMDMPITITDKPHALLIPPEKVIGDIVFDHVSFTYHQAENNGNPASNDVKNTIHDISFEIKPGQLVALVGPSGAGKTTITYLLSRLYDVDSGAITIDDRDVRDMSLQSLSESIGYVTQESFLFNDTIRENLLFAKPDATDEQIMDAAKAAAIHDKIMELEDGYDTLVGERGYKLSGGEKQRLAIARVMLKNPRILILDEATSALDTHSERLIQASLEKLMQGRTTLAIAHRLSTILAADMILVIDKGRIVEKGTHTDLLAKNGLYAKLYNQQFSHEQLQ